MVLFFVRPSLYYILFARGCFWQTPAQKDACVLTALFILPPFMSVSLPSQQPSSSWENEHSLFFGQTGNGRFHLANSPFALPSPHRKNGIFSFEARYLLFFSRVESGSCNRMFGGLVPSPEIEPCYVATTNYRKFPTSVQKTGFLFSAS